MAKFFKKLIQSLNFKKAEEKPSVQEPEIIVELKFNAHCDHCYMQVKNCIKNAKGVVNVDIDKEKSQAKVEGNFDVEKLQNHIFKKLEKRVTILNQAHPSHGKSREDEEDGEVDNDNKNNCEEVEDQEQGL